MDQNIIIKNYAAYLERLKKYLGEDIAAKLVETLGGDDKVMNATFYNMEKSGLAYNGSLVVAIFDVIRFALGINALLPEDRQAKQESIIKVGLLQHIAKVNMFEDSEAWQKKNGTIYKYTQQRGALRCGERSTFIASEIGIHFTVDEFEAMKSIDNDTVVDDYAIYYSTTLSTIMRQANELVSLKHRTAIC